MTYLCTICTVNCMDAVYCVLCVLCTLLGTVHAPSKLHNCVLYVLCTLYVVCSLCTVCITDYVLYVLLTTIGSIENGTIKLCSILTVYYVLN